MIPILDNGHGGVINGVYQTAGKRSPDWSCGVLYEGEFNRWIVDGVINRLETLNKPYYHASPELEDVSLGKRVSRANDFYKESGRDAYLVSIHANAGGGTGWEIFSSEGTTSSDKIAEVFADKFREHLPDHRDRGHKQRDFYVLKKTVGPAILIEVAFMDHEEDYKKLWDSSFRDEVIELIVEAILELY
jgi:N-acetylmuramoyl-L-alanine amidase